MLDSGAHSHSTLLRQCTYPQLWQSCHKKLQCCWWPPFIPPIPCQLYPPHSREKQSPLSTSALFERFTSFNGLQGYVTLRSSSSHRVYIVTRSQRERVLGWLLESQEWHISLDWAEHRVDPISAPHLSFLFVVARDWIAALWKKVIVWVGVGSDYKLNRHWLWFYLGCSLLDSVFCVFFFLAFFGDATL